MTILKKVDKETIDQLIQMHVAKKWNEVMQYIRLKGINPQSIELCFRSQVKINF